MGSVDNGVFIHAVVPRHVESVVLMSRGESNLQVTDDYWDDAPAIAKGNYNLWRLMIDERYQGRRFGREAVRRALDFVGTFPCGSADYCCLSYEPENGVARALYRSFGFAETGEQDGEEMIAVLELGGDNG